MCRPGADQTKRSPQQWRILAPRVRKMHKLQPSPWDYDTSSRETNSNTAERAWDAWSKLAQPAPHSRKPTIRSSVRPRQANALSRFESLPAELVALILETPSLTESDILSLGLTCTSLWLHVLALVEKKCRRAAAPLAGVEIACTGTYLTDLPESFAKDDLASSSIQMYTYLGRHTCEARKINWGAFSSYDAIPDPQNDWWAAWQAHETQILSAGISSTLAGEMAAQLLTTCSPHCASPDAPWVLRDLTTWLGVGTVLHSNR